MANRKRISAAEENQPELPAMPDATLKRACSAVLRIRDDRDEAMEAFDKKEDAASEKVKEIMLAQNQEKVTVDGFDFQVDEVKACTRLKIRRRAARKKKEEDDLE